MPEGRTNTDVWADEQREQECLSCLRFLLKKSQEIREIAVNEGFNEYVDYWLKERLRALEETNVDGMPDDLVDRRSHEIKELTRLINDPPTFVCCSSWHLNNLITDTDSIIAIAVCQGINDYVKIRLRKYLEALEVFETDVLSSLEAEYLEVEVENLRYLLNKVAS